MPHNYLLQRNANKLDVLLRNAENNLPTTYTKVIDYLQSFELFDLIDLLDVNKGIFLRLSHERYNSFWEHKLESILEDDQENNFKFKTPKFMSSASFLVGYVHFLQLVQADEEKSMAEYLSVASQYHSYHALTTWFHSVILSLYNKNESISEQYIDSCIKTIQKEALYHGTPGYLLLANFTFHLYLSLKERSTDIAIEKRQEILLIADSALYNTLKYLNMAQYLENDSENEINNAYFGMSLTQSNPFSIDTISKMKEFCNKLLNFKLSNGINKTLHDIAVNELSDLRAYHDNRAATLNSADIDNSSKENSVNQYGENPLLIAARLNDEKAFKLMLEKNMDIKQVDKQGNSALHLAVLANNTNISIDLLEKDHSLLEIKNNNGDRAIELVENKEMKELLTINMKSDHRTKNDLLFFKSTKQLTTSLAKGSPNKLFQI